MKTFLFQAGVQAAIIAVIWFLVSRDATALRDRHGGTPSSVSPFAWGALCGLTWIALIPYLMRRNTIAGTTQPAGERNLLRWWIGLALVAGVWSAGNAAQGDSNNAAQHATLCVAFVICAVIALSRDRATPDARRQQRRTALSASDDGG